MDRFFFDFLLISLSPGDVTVGTIVTDQLFAFIGDVGGDLRDPVQDREQGKVSLKVRVHLGAVEHGLGIFLVSNFRTAQFRLDQDRDGDPARGGVWRLDALAILLTFFSIHLNHFSALGQNL